jgi:hypothetical protein
MSGLTVTRRAWIGVALVTLLMVVAIVRAKAHFSQADRPAPASQGW